MGLLQVNFTICAAGKFFGRWTLDLIVEESVIRDLVDTIRGSSNPGAIRAYEKAGFVHEGRMREAFYRDNEYSDKVVMGILKSEF